MDAFLDLLRKNLPGCEHAVTKEAGEESILADQALADGGFDLIVAVGGDGTWSNVADRLVASGAENVAFGLLAAGTGNDFGRNFGLSHRSPESAVRTLAEGRVMRVDVGRVVTRGTPVGAPADVLGPTEGRHFLNLVGFGFDVAVIEAAARARFLKGAPLYKVTALKNLFSFPGVDLELTSDEPTVDGEQLMLTISNGPFFGGAFPIAPRRGARRWPPGRMRHRQRTPIHPHAALSDGRKGQPRVVPVRAYPPERRLQRELLGAAEVRGGR